MNTTAVDSLQSLVAALQAAITAGNGNLVLDAQLATQIPPVADLLRYLARTSLTVEDAILAPTTLEVTVSGTAPMFAAVSYDVALVGTVPAGDVRLTLDGTPSMPTSWTFAANFAPLPDYRTSGVVGSTGTKGLTYAASFFDTLAITSPAFAVATFTDPVEDAVLGLTFSGTLDATSGDLAPLAPYLPGSSALALTGAITMRPETFPLIDLRAPVPGLSYDVGLDTFTDIYLRLQTVHDPNADHPDVSTIRLGGYVSIAGTPQTTFALEAPMLQGMTVWQFVSVPHDEVPLAGKGELSGFLDGNVQLMPPALAESGLALQSLGFSILPVTSGQPFVKSLTAIVGTEPWVTPLPKFVVETVAVEWTFNFSTSGNTTFNQTRLLGTLAVGDPPVRLDLAADVPTWDFEAGMREGDTILVADLIAWATGIDVDLGTLSISAINLWGYPSAQEYTFFTEVTGEWPIPVPGFTFGLMNLYVYYTPNSLSAVISVQVALAGKTFTVQAATPTGGKGWVFSGGLLPGQIFSLQDFFTALLPSWGALPPSLAAITITKLYLSFDTKSGDYYIHVRLEWSYQITDYDVTIGAELILQAVHKTGGAIDYIGSVRGDFSLNNFAIAAIYAFGPKTQTVTFEVAYKRLKLSASIVTTKTQPARKKLVVRFPDLSLGEVISYFVGLAIGDTTYTLPSPWDVLNQLTLRNFSLEVDLQTNAVSVRYDIKADFVFMALTSVRLQYDESSGSGGVKLALSGKFLGKTYDIDRGTGLEWDVLNEPAPPVTAEGPEFIELRYLGFGQHVSFSGTEKLGSVGAIIDAMREDMVPPVSGERNPLAAGNGSAMRFDRASDILLGADFTILGTVALQFVFNDPYLYGIALALSGSRAKSFDGLRFELLYQRISEDVGVFKIVLRLPEAFRHLEFGEVSLTLPTMKVDIYTNGNFRVDLGFPAGGDFAESFCLQIFPFIGYGGFYFALLNGTTSDRVPRITNGAFQPVIEFGIGLRVGLGKEFFAGPLSGGISLTVEGILEGVLGWFTPNDRAADDATYYWVQGTVGIIGRLYGEVDFVVIKASVNVRASAIATVIFEAYEAIRFGLTITVEASASVTTFFVDVDFSFELEIDEQFVIGYKTTPPWTLQTAPAPTNLARVAASLDHGVQPQLRLQRGSSHRTPLDTRSAFAHPRVLAARTTRTVTLDWTAALVLDAQTPVGMSLLPAFTVAQLGQAPAAVQVDLCLFVENSVAPGATTRAERRTPSVAHSARAGDPLESPFNVLVRAMFLWSIRASLGRTTGTISQPELEALHQALESPSAGPTYSQLRNFLALNVMVQISGVPTDIDLATTVGSSVFPMIPELAYSAPGIDEINFGTYQPVDAAYERVVQTYYDQLRVDTTAGQADDPRMGTAPKVARTSMSDGDDTQSLASLTFAMYFLMLARSTVQSALDILRAYTYAPKDDDSLATIAAQFTGADVPYIVRAGDSVASICETFGMTPAIFATLNPGIDDPLAPGSTVTVQIAVTPQTIAAANAAFPLQPNTDLTLAGLLYQVRAADTLVSIATTFADAPATLLGLASNQNNPMLLRKGASFTIAVAGDDDGYAAFPYTSVTGDNLEAIAAFAYVRALGSIPDASLAWYVQTIADFNAERNIDFAAVIPTGTSLLVPGAFGDSSTTDALTYLSRFGDTLDLVARYFLVLQTTPSVLAPIIAGLQMLNPGLPWTNLPVGTIVQVPAQQRAVQDTDTFSSIAALFALDPASLAGGPNASSPTLLDPLAVMELPTLAVTTATGDTIGVLAERYNISIADLATDIATVPGIFVHPTNATLTIPGVPLFDIASLAEQVILQGGANDAATTGSRFLTSGIQLPVPTATTTFAGITTLTGQQFICPASALLPYVVTVTDPNDAAWIEFVDSAIVTQQTTDGAALLAARPSLRERNRGVDWTRGPRAGTHLFTDMVDSLAITITQTLVDTYAPDTTFDPSVTQGPAQLSPAALGDVRYTLQTTQHWQTPALPPFAGAPENAPLAGEPTIWSLTSALLERVAVLGSGIAPFGLFTAGAQGEGPGVAVRSYDWATIVDLAVRQIVPPDGDGTPLRNGYAFTGVDQAGRDRLLALFTYLDAAGETEDGTTITLLYAPNADTNNAQGFASATLDANETFLLKTNLSILTTSGNLTAQNADGDDDDDDDALYAATLAEPAQFLRLLWEGSVTGTGGYTLQYRDANGSGLPAQIFTAGAQGTLRLLVVLATQSAAQDPDRTLHDFNNCVVVGDNLDPATQSVFVQATDPAFVLARKMATMPPGNVGFELERTDPTSGTSTPALITQQLYSLLGYGIQGANGFAASNQGVPVGPARGLAVPPAPAPWRFAQIVPVAKFAQSTLPMCEALPSPANDPYAGIVPAASVLVDLAFHDLFGNTLAPTPTIDTLPIPVAYIDDVIGVAQWPALACDYTLTLAANDLAIEIGMALQVSNYVPSPGASLDAVLRTASAHRARYEQIYYQIEQDDICVAVTTSLNQAAESAPYRYLPDFIPLLRFARAAYVYVAAAAAIQTPATMLAGLNATLLTVAQGYAGTDAALLAATIAAFGRANAATPTSALFAAPIDVPSFHTVAYGDTLAMIVAGTSVSVATLARNNADIPLNAGVDIAAPKRTVVPQSGNRLIDIATAVSADAGRIAEANATTRGILTAGKILRVNGVSVTVAVVPDAGSTQSFTDLTTAFLAAGVNVSVAQIAVANQTETDLFIATTTTLDILDYVITPGSTFTSLAAAYPEFSVAALAQAAQNSPNCFVSGVQLYVSQLASLVPASTTLTAVAETYGTSLDQLVAFNATVTLVDGATLFLPDRVQLNATANAARAPYSVAATDSLDTVATLFGEASTLAFATRNRALPNMFRPAQTIAVGSASTQTTAADSLDTVLARLQTQDAGVTFEQLVAVVAPQTTLLALGGLLLTVLPSTGDRGTLSALEQAFHVSPALIAQGNAALAGFVVGGQSVTAGGAQLTTHAGDTFTSLVERFAIEASVQTSVSEIATLNATVPLLGANIAFLLPPNAARLNVPLGAGYAQNPTFPETIFPLNVTLAIERTGDVIDPAFTDAPAVRASASGITPRATPGENDALSLRGFALDAEAAFAHTIKLATAGASTAPGPKQLWVVNFGTTGIASVEIDGSAPTFFARAPLSTTLSDGKNIPIRTFDPATGTLQPQLAPPLMDFQAVDLDVWGTSALAAVDQMLSPQYAIPAYLQNPDAFTTLVAAKKTLAAAISQSVANVLAESSAEARLVDAQARLEQALLVNLTDGYAVDTIVQYPATVASTFTGALAPRLCGQATCNVYRTGETDDLTTLATYYGINEVSVATLLGPIVRILNTAVTFSYNGTSYPISADATIDSLMRTVGATSYAAFVAGLSTPSGFFAPATTINTYLTQAAASDTTTAPAGPTFETFVDYFDDTLSSIALQNQDRLGIFTDGVTITIPGYAPKTVTAQTNSLTLMAAQIGLADGVDLAHAVASTTSLLAPAFIINVVRLLPEQTLSSAKTSLASGTSTMNILLRLKSEAHRRKLFLDLLYPLNELEFGIRTIEGTGGYQASSWLSFVIPIGSAGDATTAVSAQLGQVEIPVPLRAYPPSPLLIEQNGTATITSPASINEAKQWTYAFAYEHRDAAQDTLALASTFGLSIAPSSRLLARDELLAQLAQFSSAYPAMQNTLAELLLPLDVVNPVLASTLQTFADLITTIAQAWISSTMLAAMQSDTVTGTAYAYTVTFTTKDVESVTLLDSLTLTLTTSGTPSPNGSFPVVAWRLPGNDAWHDLRKDSESATQCVYSYVEPVPAFVAIQHRLSVPGIDIVAVQNATSAMNVARNANLLATRATSSAFIYTTSLVTFPRPLTPIVEQQQLIPIRTGSEDLQTALQNMFDDLFGSSSTVHGITLAVQFGYDLVPSPSDVTKAIVSRLPILFLPQSSYDVGLSARIATAIEMWQSDKPFAANQGWYIFDVSVFSTLLDANALPILELNNAYFDRAPITERVLRAVV